MSGPHKKFGARKRTGLAKIAEKERGGGLDAVRITEMGPTTVSPPIILSPPSIFFLYPRFPQYFFYMGGFPAGQGRLLLVATSFGTFTHFLLPFLLHLTKTMQQIHFIG